MNYLNCQHHISEYKDMCKVLAGGKECTCQCMRSKIHRFIPWVFKSLEKETATHISMLAWKILYTLKSGGLQ